MKYGIREEEELEADSHQRKIKIENEIQGLRNQIALLSFKFVRNSSRLNLLELTTAQKEVKKRAKKISAVNFHKNPRQRVLTPKLYACQRKPGTQRKETGQCTSDGFCKTEAQTENVFGQTIPSDIYTAPFSGVPPKPFGNYSKCHTAPQFPDLSQERILIELLNQIGKIESKMNDMVDSFSSVQCQLNDVSSRLSLVESHMSSVDMFLTMQRYNQKWQDLMPTIEYIGATEYPLDQDIELGRDDVDRRNESNAMSDKLMVTLSDTFDLAIDCFIHLKEIQKMACKTKRTMEEIKLPSNDPCSTCLNSSNVTKPTPSDPGKSANSTNIVDEIAETKSSADFLGKVHDSGMKIRANSPIIPSVSIPSGDGGKFECTVGEFIKQNNNLTGIDNDLNRATNLPDENGNTIRTKNDFDVQNVNLISNDIAGQVSRVNVKEKSVNPGIEHFPNRNIGQGGGSLRECIKQNINAAGEGNNRHELINLPDENKNTEIEMTHMKVPTALPIPKDATYSKKQEVRQPSENVCQPPRGLGIDHTDSLECYQNNNRVQVQAECPFEDGIDPTVSKGGCGEDLENLRMPLLLEENCIKDGEKTSSPGGDGENESLIGTKSGEQETTKPSTHLVNEESINVLL